MEGGGGEGGGLPPIPLSRRKIQKGTPFSGTVVRRVRVVHVSSALIQRKNKKGVFDEAQACVE